MKKTIYLLFIVIGFMIGVKSAIGIAADLQNLQSKRAAAINKQLAQSE